MHQIPKLAIDLYIYFAGLVNDKVGVTYYQITAERQRVREHNRRRLGGKLAFQGIYRYLPFAGGTYSDEDLKSGISMDWRLYAQYKSVHLSITLPLPRSIINSSHKRETYNE